jgi:calcineurin-like phosphoesterase family protein
LYIGHKPWKAVSKVAGRIERSVEVDDIKPVGAVEIYK